MLSWHGLNRAECGHQSEKRQSRHRHIGEMHLLLFINTRKFTFNNGNKMEYTFTLLSLRLALMKVYFLVMNSKSCKRDLSYPNEFSLFTSLVVLYPDLYTFCCSLPVNVLSYAKLELINAKIHSFYWDDTHLRFCHDILKFYTKSHVHEYQQTTINTILLYIGGLHFNCARRFSSLLQGWSKVMWNPNTYKSNCNEL